MSDDAFKARSMKRKNVKGLALNSSPVATTASSSLGPPKDDRRGEPLEIGVEFRLDLRNEDLQFIKELGAGNGGTVTKVLHTSTKSYMARKVRLVLMRWRERD